MTLRRARPEDRPALIDICIRTGHRGQDAQGVYSDPSLLAELYLLPYLALAPDWAWVHTADDGLAPLGYLVATPDTRDFMQRAEAQRWPALRATHPLPAQQDSNQDSSPQARLTRVLHTGPLHELPFLDSHPAHLHIDLLPQAQRQGHGSALMAFCIDALRAAGVPGVHLGVSAQNPHALAFYRRLGFTTLQETGWGRWMGTRC
jgi:ribosomal protein S18 acetylase RimI-like enzyme